MCTRKSPVVLDRDCAGAAYAKGAVPRCAPHRACLCSREGRWCLKHLHAIPVRSDGTAADSDAGRKRVIHKCLLFSRGSRNRIDEHFSIEWSDLTGSGMSTEVRPNCGESLERGYGVCWRCGMHLDGSPLDKGFVPDNLAVAPTSAVKRREIACPRCGTSMLAVSRIRFHEGTRAWPFLCSWSTANHLIHMLAKAVARSSSS